MATVKNYVESKLASQLKRIVNSKCLSQKQIAEITGFHHRSVNAQLNCRMHLDKDFVLKLAENLKLKIDFENGEIKL